MSASVINAEPSLEHQVDVLSIRQLLSVISRFQELL
jgi:hypothetical protein